MKAFFHMVILTWLLAGRAHGLFLDSTITAYRVANGLIAIDGKPDLVWKEVGGANLAAASRIQLNSVQNLVLLADRNRLPDAEYPVPEAGSVTLLAAYDDAYLYFFFIVRETGAFNSLASSCGLANLWKANAVQVFVDPAAWSESLYSAYFSADAGQASYGTSGKTFEVAMPAWPGENRKYYRDRTDSNTFKLRTQPPSQLRAVSAARLATDSLTVGVELRIPIAASEYPDRKSLFVSWGYNRYSGSGNECDALPIAYRWAKHVKSYAGVNPKPPGWKSGDSVHFDPLASYDGWGRMYLAGNFPLNGSGCRQPLADSAWDMGSWRASCYQSAVSIGRPAERARFLPADPEAGTRDIRGRRTRTLSPWRRFFPAPEPAARPWTSPAHTPAAD